jgi:hypothetical protein
MKFYLTITALLAFLAMECTGVYWLMTGSLPPALTRVDPTVLVAGTVGVTIAFIWALVSMFNHNPD